MAESDVAPIVTVDRRFIGPGGAGGAGVVCGLVAAFVEGPVQVRLHRSWPLPLLPLSAHRLADDRVELRERDTVIASASPLVDPVEPLPPVALGRGREGFEHAVGGLASLAPFVWGPSRSGSDPTVPTPAGDGLYASPWRPVAGLVDDHGHVPAGLLWAVLDGASGWAAGTMDAPGAALRLDILAGVVHAAPPAGTPCLVVGRADGRRGRALLSRSAIYTVAGRLVGAAAATWHAGVRGR